MKDLKIVFENTDDDFGCDAKIHFIKNWVDAKILPLIPIQFSTVEGIEYDKIKLFKNEELIFTCPGLRIDLLSQEISTLL